MSKRNLWIDQVVGWTHLSTLEDQGDRRRYYVAPAPLRLLVVCRNGLQLGDLLNRTVDAQIGVDQGMPGFARVPELVQTKITIYRITQSPWDDRLSRVLRVAYRD